MSSYRTEAVPSLWQGHGRCPHERCQCWLNGRSGIRRLGLPEAPVGCWPTAPKDPSPSQRPGCSQDRGRNATGKGEAGEGKQGDSAKRGEHDGLLSLGWNAGREVAPAGFAFPISMRPLWQTALTDPLHAHYSSVAFGSSTSKAVPETHRDRGLPSWQ